MSDFSQSTYQPIERWLKSEAAIQSAVLFGSGALAEESVSQPDQWSDVDLHIITTDAEKIRCTDWKAELPSLGFRFQAVRAATGGVEKLTVVFANGQMDLIIVPRAKMRLARLAMTMGIHRWHRGLEVALNEIQTCLRSGYRFLKGEEKWGAFYQRVATSMPGVRLSDPELCALADVAVVDLLWIRQKLARGELCASQHLLHRSIGETNLRFARELRLRRGEPLPSFGLGRRAEKLYRPEELQWVQIDARCDREELRQATEKARQGLVSLMHELFPEWTMPVLPDSE